MAQRQACLATLAGRSYTAATVVPSISHIRAAIARSSIYGSTVHFTHAAPAVREYLEGEQRKRALIITGCIKLTGKHTLTAEVGLTPLSMRAKDLVG